MTIDEDLDIMNSMKDLPEGDAALYFRSDLKDGDGFYFYTGTVEDLGNALLGLMEIDEAILAAVCHAVNNMEDGT